MGTIKYQITNNKYQIANLRRAPSERHLRSAICHLPFDVLYLLFAISLAACQAWLPFGPGGTPEAVSSDATPGAQPSPTPTEVVGNPPGPVLVLAPLPGGEFLAGVGPVGNAETGFEWRLYRGQGDTWQRLNWPAEAAPRALRPAPGGDLIFAVPFSNAMYGRGQAWGLMRSADGGRSWRQALTGLDDPNVMDVALSPAFDADRTLWAVTWYNGVYRSTDGGESWQALPPPHESGVEPSGGANPYDLALAFSPDYRAPRSPAPGDQPDAGRGLALASFGRGLQRWDPATEAWQTIPLSVTATVKDFDPPEAQLAAGAIAFSPAFADDGTIYLQSGYSGIFRSTDRGKTWLPAQRRLKLPSPPVADFQLAVASSDEAYVLLAGDQGQVLYRTRNGGTTWEALENPPTLGRVSAFALGRDAMGHTVLYLGGSRGGVISYVADSLRWD
jgi:hypothetical protein